MSMIGCTESPFAQKLRLAKCALLCGSSLAGFAKHKYSILVQLARRVKQMVCALSIHRVSTGRMPRRWKRWPRRVSEHEAGAAHRLARSVPNQIITRERFVRVWTLAVMLLKLKVWTPLRGVAQW